MGILNSDDFYTDENVLQTVADNFMNHSVDAVYGDIHFVHDVVKKAALLAEGNEWIDSSRRFL